MVNVIFVENGQDGFDIGSIMSRQTHALVLVRRKWTNVIKLQVFVKEGVSQIIHLPGDPIFCLDTKRDSDRFLNFRTPFPSTKFDQILVVDLEKLCYEAEPFKTKLIRTRTALFYNIINKV